MTCQLELASSHPEYGGDLGEAVLSEVDKENMNEEDAELLIAINAS